MKDVVKLHMLDISRSPRVFVVELHYQFWSGDFGGWLPGIVFTAMFFPLDKVLESSLMPATVEYLFYFPLCFAIDDYGQWVVCCFLSYNRVIQSWSKLHYIEHWIELLHLVWQF